MVEVESRPPDDLGSSSRKSRNDWSFIVSYSSFLQESLSLPLNMSRKLRSRTGSESAGRSLGHLSDVLVTAHAIHGHSQVGERGAIDVLLLGLAFHLIRQSLELGGENDVV